MTLIAQTNQTTPLSPFRVFRNRNFTLLWIGQLVETMGTALTSLASSIYVFRITGSAASVGLMLIATAAPSLVVGLIAGAFVDRYDRRKIMLIAEILRAGLVFLIPWLLPVSIAWLYIIVALSASVGQFFDPAHESILPETASEDELAAANSLMAISSFGSTAIGFAASGLIASMANISWAFYLNAFSFLFSAVCVLLVKVKPLPVEDQINIKIIIKNIQSGLNFLFETPILRSLFLVFVPVLISFGLSNSLLLPFAIDALRATEFEYGIQEGLTSLGFVAGSLLMASVFDRLREGPWFAISYISQALLGVVYAFLTNIPMAIVLVAISGVMNAPSAIGRRVVIQRNTPREMRGRVNSAFFVTRDILFIIGMSAAGLADVIDVRMMYLISSLILLAGGIWVLFLPGLRQAAAEWQKALHFLRAAPAAPGLAAGRAATSMDFDMLAGVLPGLSALSSQERAALVQNARIIEAPAGTAILRYGEVGEAAYFILSGRTLAGSPTESGEYRQLSEMLPGDFFGEIAALTGARRTANVVAQANTILLQVPAETLRNLMSHPALSQLVLTKMADRLHRTSIKELPRFAGVDQQALKEIRAEVVE